MKQAIGWQFQETLNGSWKGFNDGDIAHFKGDRYGSLAREVIQNSLDVRDDLGKPVELAFELVNLKTSEIPDHSGLLKKFVNCKSYAAKEKKEAGEFFTKGIELLKAKTIPVLKISEKNTTGMAGPCELGNPFFAYMKATGTSKKESDTATGSHGIGKKAPLTTSNLRTIFVSTRWRQKNKELVAFQGIATLMSHMKGDKTFDGVGYWGIENGCGPVEDSNQIPVAFSRKTVGTNFYVIGFREKKDWAKQLIAAVAKSFFAAIWRGELVVTVSGTEISKANIAKVFEDKSIELAIGELKGEPDSFLLSKEFLRCEMTKVGDQKSIDNSEVLHLGNCQIQILVAEGLKQRVCVLRNNMLISSQLDRLVRFPNMKDFVAIIECKSNTGIRLLRGMEPARHDTFDPEQFEAEETVKKATSALRKMTEWARQMLKKHAQIETEGGGPIDFLSDLFKEELEGAGQASLERNPNGKLIFQPKPIRSLPAPDVPDDDEDDGDEGGGPGGGEGGDGNGGGGYGGGSGGKGNDGNKKDKKTGKTSIHLRDVRAISESDAKTRLTFTPDLGGDIEIRVYAIGADSEEWLPLQWADSGTKVIDGVAHKKVIGGKRVTLLVKTNRQSAGGIKVTANEV